MNIDDVHKGVTKHRSRNRLGRGPGSGNGKTAGRGHKGQKSNPGYSAHPTFQGGTMPLVRRIPKRGFNNPFALRVMVVNVGDLDAAFEAGDDVTPDQLRVKDLAKGRYDRLKILGNGQLTKRLVVSAHEFSKTAVEQIEKAGGKVQVLPGKVPAAHKIKAAREANRQHMAASKKTKKK